MKSDYFNYVIKVFTYLFFALGNFFIYKKNVSREHFFESFKKFVEMPTILKRFVESIGNLFRKLFLALLSCISILIPIEKNRSLNKYVGNQASPDVFMLIRSFLVPLRCGEPPPELVVRTSPAVGMYVLYKYSSALHDLAISASVSAVLFV